MTVPVPSDPPSSTFRQLKLFVAILRYATMDAEEVGFDPTLRWSNGSGDTGFDPTLYSKTSTQKYPFVRVR